MVKGERRTQLRDRWKTAPYPRSSPEAVAWWKGFYDRQAGHEYNSETEVESVTLAYAHGWKAGAK